MAVSETDIIRSKMLDAKKVIDAVSEKFYKDPLYSEYIKFEINGVTFSTVSTQKNSNIIMSLTNKKSGTGAANAFTLTLAYAPQLGDEWGASSANSLEHALSGITPKSGSASLECKIEYGYADEASSLFRTASYDALLIDYECTIQDSMLIYTLTGYSNLIAKTEDKSSITLSEMVIDAKNDAKDLVGPITPIELGGEVVNGVVVNSENDALGTSKIQPTYAVDYIIKNYLPDYSVKYGTIKGQSVLGSDVPVSLTTQLDKNPMTAMTDILNCAVHESQSDRLKGTGDTDPTTKITYKWHISEYGGAKTIYVTALDPNENNSASVSVTFNWMAPGRDRISHFVLDFKPNFNGSSIIALWNSSSSKYSSDRIKSINAYRVRHGKEKINEDMSDKQYFIGNDGMLVETGSTDIPAPGGDVESTCLGSEQNKSDWARAVQYPYEATMTTIGVPCEIPITGLLGIHPIIYDSEHHSGGTYMVTEIEDVINASGFTTNWKLMKVDYTTATPNNTKTEKNDDNNKEIPENLPEKTKTAIKAWRVRHA